jgi:phosphoribosyl 1,2-cyclic phosphate phosphodiesterase
VRVTILGCGTSGGVPRLGGKDGTGEWGAADPADLRNRRSRCSILVQNSGKTVLVDTSPDVRAQLLAARAETVDAVIWSHEHADQVHGIDDLRPYTFRRGAIEAWADARTLTILRQRFGYVFEAEGDGFYHVLYDVKAIHGPFTAAGALAVTPIPLDHGSIPSLGFRFGDVLYVNDVVRVPEEAFALMRDADALIIDAMRYRPHPTHAHLELGPGMDRSHCTPPCFSHQPPCRHGLC